MSFTVINASRMAVDAPIDTSLLNDLYSNEVFLNTNQNAPQDTNGSPNIVNGSFELDASGTGTPTGWTFTAGTGGTGTVTNTDQNHGSNSYKVTQDNTSGHTGGVLTGPYASGNQYMNVSPSQSYQVSFMLKCSRVDVKNSCVINWYNSSQSFLSSTTVQSIANGSAPTSWTTYTLGSIVPPAGAVLAQIVFNLGSDNVTPPGATTSIFLDGISWRVRTPFSQSQNFTSSSSFTVPNGVYFVHLKLYGLAANQAGTTQNAFGGYCEAIASVKPGDVATITISNAFAGSSTVSLNGSTYTFNNASMASGGSSGTASGGTINLTGGSTAQNFVNALIIY